jgi:hypothetical protein
LSTDSGSTGLNLQAASVVVNCDLPWNPAKLEQRIARAWRKHQTRPVTVINLVSENTIEHRMLETIANKRALSDGVLDLEGDLGTIKLRTGRQALLAKLEQLVGATVTQTETNKISTPSPADRALGFSQRLRQQLNGALLRCEERYPAEGAHSVLCVVVDRDAAQWRDRLGALHAEFFGPGQGDPLAPVQLEILDRATDEALARLLAAGLISGTTRATRQLFPESEPGGDSSSLSADERLKLEAHHSQAARRLKMTRLLAEGGLTEEARTPLLDSAHALGCALAVQHRLPEPANLDDALMPPLSHFWQDALAPLRDFINDKNRPCSELLERLTHLNCTQLSAKA